jgi:4-hydroxy-4-methyl-2-oxoglutarate aldolase
MLSDAIVKTAASLSTATLYEAAGRTGALPCAIKPLDAYTGLCGRVFTVQCGPGDNLALHHAIYAASPGDVLVADCGGAPEYGYWGEITTLASQKRGLGGLVITGGVRDSRQIVRMGFPVFAGAICILGTVKDPANGGRIGGPLTIGGVHIETGDLVCGDADGVVIVSAGRAVEVVASSRARDDQEALQLQRLKDGESTLDIFRLPPLLDSDVRGEPEDS